MSWYGGKPARCSCDLILLSRLCDYVSSLWRAGNYFKASRCVCEPSVLSFADVSCKLLLVLFPHNDFFLNSAPSPEEAMLLIYKTLPVVFFCFSFLKRQWGNLKLWRLQPQQSHRLRRLHCFKWEAFIGPSRFSSEETSRHLHLVYSFSPHLIAVISPSPLYRCTDKIKKLKTSTLARQRQHVVTQFGLTGRDIKTGTWSWWNRTLAFDEICWTSDTFVKRGC